MQARLKERSCWNRWGNLTCT